jgi:acyl-CoA synthetase (AMP-forming)/AMP-acid ligase II
MRDIMDGTTVGAVFATTVAAHADRPFLAVPARSDRDYLPDGFEITYGAAAAEVDRLIAAYRAAGYGAGHRVATLLENRPEYVLHKLALNTLGVCCVPINPDYRAGEIAYLLDPLGARPGAHPGRTNKPHRIGPGAGRPPSAGGRGGRLRHRAEAALAPG